MVAGLVLRHVLRFDDQASRDAAEKPLSPALECIYIPVSREVETQTAILSIALNDAINERNAGRREIAWRLVSIAASEWERVAEIVPALLDAMQKNMPQVDAMVPYRGIVARRFKSQAMIDFLRMHELLDRLVYRSKMRFSLQIHILRRAALTLTTEFGRAYHYGERTEDRPPEIWQRLDVFSHDFDLVSKEALMAFRAFLVCLPPSALDAFAADLEPILRRSVRSAIVQDEF